MPARARQIVVRTERVARSAKGGERGCCPYYHEAVELIGKRWTGAILQVLLVADRPLRFSQIAQAVPELSDRLLSERIKELEARGLVLRTVHDGPGIRVEYALTEAGEQLEPVVIEIQAWARRWMG
jgi:DNA-binding HxlR family transcriptional regulator